MAVETPAEEASKAAGGASTQVGAAIANCNACGPACTLAWGRQAPNNQCLLPFAATPLLQLPSPARCTSSSARTRRRRQRQQAQTPRTVLRVRRRVLGPCGYWRLRNSVPAAFFQLIACLLADCATARLLQFYPALEPASLPAVPLVQTWMLRATRRERRRTTSCCPLAQQPQWPSCCVMCGGWERMRCGSAGRRLVRRYARSGQPASKGWLGFALSRRNWWIPDCLCCCWAASKLPT